MRPLLDNVLSVMKSEQALENVDLTQFRDYQVRLGRSPGARSVSEFVKNFNYTRPIRRLHRGSFGDIELKEDPATRELVAVKTLQPGPGLTGDLTRQLMQEIDMLVRLRHPCIIEFVGYTLPTPTSPARIGTLFMANGSLRDVIGRGALDATAISIIISGIVWGMKHLHSNDIVHRNLKPENTFVDHRGYPRIGGLAKSRLLSLDLTLTTGVGSFRYSAPELFDGSGDCSSGVDVFSFALVTYELLTASPVFPPTIDLGNWMRQVEGHVRPAVPATLPRRTRSIIKRCWSADPDVRHSFEEIWDELERMEFAVTGPIDRLRFNGFLSYIQLATH
jgi:serine/threonine protein kinase